MKITIVRYALLAVVVLLGSACPSLQHDMAPEAGAQLAGAVSKAAAKPVDPPIAVAPSDFRVVYAGIISHALIRKDGNVNESCADSSDPDCFRRAIIIQGNTMNMRHQPMLGVVNVDVGSLNNAAGQAVQSCDHFYCWVPIRGIQMRVVDEVVTDREIHYVELIGPVAEDPSFVALVPSLQKDDYVKGGDLRQSLKSVELPPPPAQGYFDMSGGTLFACPFHDLQQAKFERNGSSCRQFADVVFWSGQTAHRARLQIRSSANSNDWRTVKLKSDTPLMIAVANLSNEHNTSGHFVLNEKIVANSLPTINTKDCKPCDPNNVTCYTCIAALNDVAGCSDTRWP